MLRMIPGDGLQNISEGAIVEDIVRPHNIVKVRAYTNWEEVLLEMPGDAIWRHRTYPYLVQVMPCHLWSLLLTWFNFNPSMDK